MAFDMTSTHKSRYPNLAPASMSVAQLPGSMYPTLTRYAGPANASIRFQKETWPVPTVEWTSASDRVSCTGPVVAMYLTIVKYSGQCQELWRACPTGARMCVPFREAIESGFLREA